MIYFSASYDKSYKNRITKLFTQECLTLPICVYTCIIVSLVLEL